MSGTEGPLSHIEENHLFISQNAPYGGARLAGRSRVVKHRRSGLGSALGFASVFATTDHDFPSRRQVAVMFAMGP